MGQPQNTDLFGVRVGATQGVEGSGAPASVLWSEILAAINAQLPAGVELATDAEAAAGTDATKAINPLQLAAAIAVSVAANPRHTSTFGYDAATHVITHTDGNGITTSADLSALTTDIYVTGGTLAGTVLTLTDPDSGTADVTIDLANLASTITLTASTASFVHQSGNGTSTTVDMLDFGALPARP